MATGTYLETDFTHTIWLLWDIFLIWTPQIRVTPSRRLVPTTSRPPFRLKLHRHRQSSVRNWEIKQFISNVIQLDGSLTDRHRNHIKFKLILYAFYSLWWTSVRRVISTNTQHKHTPLQKRKICLAPNLQPFPIYCFKTTETSLSLLKVSLYLPSILPQKR